MEKNRELYQRYFKIWVISIAACAVLAFFAGYMLSGINPNHLIPLLAAILLLPIIFVSADGLKKRYSPAPVWNHIYRGTVAVVINSLYIVIYVVILSFFLTRLWRT